MAPLRSMLGFVTTTVDRRSGTGANCCDKSWSIGKFFKQLSMVCGLADCDHLRTTAASCALSVLDAMPSHLWRSFAFWMRASTLRASVWASAVDRAAAASKHKAGCSNRRSAKICPHMASAFFLASSLVAARVFGPKLPAPEPRAWPARVAKTPVASSIAFCSAGNCLYRSPRASRSGFPGTPKDSCRTYARQGPPRRASTAGLVLADGGEPRCPSELFGCGRCGAFAGSVRVHLQAATRARTRASTCSADSIFKPKP